MEVDNLLNDRERFETLCNTIIGRKGIDELLEWINNSTDFYEAPASTRFHGSFKGGLLKHSLAVFDSLMDISNVYTEYTGTLNIESLAIVSLFHDLCKCNFYSVEKRNRKNESGNWESYDAYKVDEKFKFGGHGSKSLYIIMSFMKLKPEEAVAINCHMGAYDNEHVGDSYEQYPLAWLLHVADEAATHIKGI